jgi:tetratricopeptide (TPR) repeat protein
MEVCGYQTLQHIAAVPLYAYVTFGKWDEIINYERPKDERPYILAVWHYARAMAFISKDDLISAEREIAELEKYLHNKSIEELVIWGINSAGLLVEIAYEVSQGELAAKKNNFELAIAHLTKAVELEGQLRYDEPPTWFYPCRQNLGAVLIEAGKYEAAEKVYLENLSEIPDNGWALFGLYLALLKQNKLTQAAEVETRFNEAWKYSDIQLTSSRIL